MRARTPFLHWHLLFAVLASSGVVLGSTSAQAAPPELFECVSGGMRRGLSILARMRGIESWNVRSLAEDLGPRLQSLESERPRTLKFKTLVRLDGGAPGQTYRSPRSVHQIFTPGDTRAYEALISQLAESGYLLSGPTWSRGALEVEFTFNSDLVLSDSVPPPPFRPRSAPASDGGDLSNLPQRNPSICRRESKLYGPTWGLILTARTLDEIPQGQHSFVVLVGEDFIRLGTSHPIIGGREYAKTAGDLEIGRDAGTGRPTVTWINNRSDTYQPSRETLPTAVEALWRQGIYPPDLKLLNWDRQEIFLRLRANP